MIFVSCYVELGTTFPTGLYVRHAKTDQPAHSNRLISHWCQPGDALDPVLPTRCTPKASIRLRIILRGCAV